MLQIVDSRKFWQGTLFLGIGAVALWELPWPIGSVTSMGPGYFPMLLGIGLLIAGGASVLLSLRPGERTHVEHLSLTPTFFIIGGVVLLALLLEPAGLAVSLLVMVLATCHSRLRQHPVQVAVIYVAVLALCWFVFIYLTQLPLKLFW